MERGFGEDFGTVTVTLFDGAGGEGGPAWTVGDRIYLDARWYRPTTWLGATILAHELTHVVQKRRGKALAGRSTPAALVEAEAHAAAVLVAAGGRFTCAVADRAETPRYWGPGGHYYTIYFVLLAAGVNPVWARRLSFYAQFPDQVTELDATEAGYEIAKLRSVGAVKDGIRRVAQGALGGLGDAANHLPWQRPADWLQKKAEAMDPGPARAKAIQRDYQIQRGLHCLNGGPSDGETAKRGKRLRDFPLESFAFGLAIHPYGDSFAHRDVNHPDRMYSGFLGHAVDLVRHADGHMADKLHKRRPLYKAYGQALYEIVAAKVPAPAKGRPLDGKLLADRLDRVSALKDEEAQIALLRKLATDDTKHPIDPSFTPEKGRDKKGVPWEEFKKRHKTVIDLHYREALRLAEAWSK